MSTLNTLLESETGLGDTLKNKNEMAFLELAILDKDFKHTVGKVIVDKVVEDDVTYYINMNGNLDKYMSSMNIDTVEEALQNLADYHNLSVNEFCVVVEDHNIDIINLQKTCKVVRR